MCKRSETSPDVVGVLRSGHAFERSNESQSQRRRRQPGDDPHSLRKRAQRQARANFTKVAQRTARVVESGSTGQLSFLREELERPNLGYYDSESLQDGGRERPNHQASNNTAYIATQLCNGTFGSGSRYSHDQQTTGAQFIRNHHDLSALSTAALGTIAQSDRLAPDSAKSQVGRALSAVPSARTSSTAGPKIRVIDLLKEYAFESMYRHSHRIAFQVESVLAKVTLCRTKALGCRLHRCHACNHEVPIYNSCIDRHCPQCSGGRRFDWVNKTAALLIPAVNYFQAVFTLPDTLSSFALGNRKEIYSLLMQSTWSSLSTTLRDEQGIIPAAKLVLHTWNQELDVHLHVHALVQGGGPSLDETRWIETKHPIHKNRKKLYLCDNRELSVRFQESFIEGLRKLFRQGRLKFEYSWQGDSESFESWLTKLSATAWNVYVQPPPKESSSPEQVVKYLARYMTGGPISDSRLISHAEGQITFWARSRDKKNQSRPYKLSGVQFVYKWSQHILPKGFTKSRSYGGFHTTKSAKYLELCSGLLDKRSFKSDTQPQSDVPILKEQPSEVHEHGPKCPKCSQPMTVTGQPERRSWKKVFEGPDRPDWYRAFGFGDAKRPHWHRER